MPLPTSSNATHSPELEWHELVQATPDLCKVTLAATVAQHSSGLADHFYEYMLGHPQAQVFLNHEVVHERLHASMQRWLGEIFQHPMTDATAIVAHQRHVGEVHARIQLPVYLVARGARLLKKNLELALAPQFDDPKLLAQTIAYAAQIMDLALELMSASYERNSQRGARNDEAYRLFSVGQNIAVERERQRVVLLEWGQEVLFTLHRTTGAVMLPSLGVSEFGLWFNHKACTMFEGDAELEQILVIIERVDTSLLPLLRAPAQQIRPQSELVQQLQQELDGLKFLLTSLFERHQEVENGRDSLTRLLNRRFLPSVMNREIHIAQTRNTGFALLLLDLDHFKLVNDEHGHEGGDLVLQQAATLLMSCVRNGDFIFRYGGEELLVMLVEVQPDTALRIAELIRQTFETTAFQVGQGRSLQVTASIGVALYDGHPDPQYLIKQADDAMYLAKQQGRNRVVLAQRG